MKQSMMAVLAVAAAHAVNGEPVRDIAVPVRATFGAIAEGFAASGGSMKVAYRMFSAPDFPQLCAKSPGTVRLAATNAELHLRQQHWFALANLQVEALDEDGRALAEIPIAIEVDGAEPRLFDLTADMLADARLLPVRAGTGVIRVRTLCADVYVDIPFTIR